MKQRLDEILLQQGYVSTLPEAVSLIMTRKVEVNAQVMTKPGTLIRLNQDVLQVKSKSHPYVSRGGVKLRHALEVFNLEVTDCIAVDVGASTGGFTDCLLQAGAALVYAVDVGKQQLHHRLVKDARVVNWQARNGRHLTRESFAPSARPWVGVTDVSFVSLRHILPPLCASLTPVSEQGAWVLALLKPQFEAYAYLSPEEAQAFNGVITDEALRQRIKNATLADLQALLPDWHLAGVSESPITGASGNVEYLLWWVFSPLHSSDAISISS